MLTGHQVVSSYELANELVVCHCLTQHHNTHRRVSDEVEHFAILSSPIARDEHTLGLNTPGHDISIARSLWWRRTSAYGTDVKAEKLESVSESRRQILIQEEPGHSKGLSACEGCEFVFELYGGSHRFERNLVRGSDQRL